MVSAADVAAAIRPETILVSIMHANNETAGRCGSRRAV
jgi:cysteine sulfinate desulfinase/cysteine desulfurase-like protein